MDMGGISWLDFSDLDRNSRSPSYEDKISQFSTHNLLNWLFNFNQTCFKFIVKRGITVD